jgi:hypothetical protein
MPRENVETTLPIVNSATVACSDEVILPTILVRIPGKDGRKRTVRALIDSGSQRSYILRSTADELELVPKDELKIVHNVFGGITRPTTHRKFAIRIQDVRGQFQRDITVLDSEKICGGRPTISKGPWLDKLKERDIWLNDIGEESLPIEMLIGADWYAAVITGEMIELENGLTAMETRFGWTVVGALSQGMKRRLRVAKRDRIRPIEDSDDDKFETADEYMRSNMYYGSGYFSMLDVCTPVKDSGNWRRNCRWGFEKSSRWEHLQNWRK